MEGLAGRSLPKPKEYCAEEYDWKEPRQIAGSVATLSVQSDTSRRMSMPTCFRTLAALEYAFAFTKNSCGTARPGHLFELADGSAQATLVLYVIFLFPQNPHVEIDCGATRRRN